MLLIWDYKVDCLLNKKHQGPCIWGRIRSNTYLISSSSFLTEGQAFGSSLGQRSDFLFRPNLH